MRSVLPDFLSGSEGQSESIGYPFSPATQVFAPARVDALSLRRASNVPSVISVVPMETHEVRTSEPFVGPNWIPEEA